MRELLKLTKNKSSIVVIGSGPSASILQTQEREWLTDESLIVTCNDALSFTRSDIHVSVDGPELMRCRQMRIAQPHYISRPQLASLFPARNTGSAYDFPGSGAEAIQVAYAIHKKTHLPLYSIGIDFGVFCVSGVLHHYATWHSIHRERKLVRRARLIDYSLDAYYPNGFHRQTQILKRYPAPHVCLSAIDTRLILQNVKGISHAINENNVRRVIDYLKINRFLCAKMQGGNVATPREVFFQRENQEVKI